MISIARADFEDPALQRFLADHLAEMEPTAPAESRHALDATAIQDPAVRLWVATEEATPVGTVALKQLASRHEELKSMRTDPANRGRGVGTILLQHAIADARDRNVNRISLETGSMDFFAPARALYRKHGFTDCGPFGNYTDDPNSSFLTIMLR